MEAEPAGGSEVRAALSYLYGAVGTLLREDTDALDMLLGQALHEVALGDLLEAGALSVAEQLRSVAEVRELRPAALVEVMSQAHLEMTGSVDVFTLLLQGAQRYLQGQVELWDLEQLISLAESPLRTVDAMSRLLTASVTWHARDVGACPSRLVERVCLGLAARAVDITT